MAEEKKSNPVVENFLLPMFKQLGKFATALNKNPPLEQLSSQLSNMFSRPANRPVERKSESLRIESKESETVLEEEVEAPMEKERVKAVHGFHRRRDRDAPAMF